MAKWIASPLHCSNIMNPRYTEYAIACASDQSAKQKAIGHNNLQVFKVDSKKHQKFNLLLKTRDSLVRSTHSL